MCGLKPTIILTSINNFVYKMSENSEQWLSRVSIAHGNAFANYNHMKAAHLPLWDAGTRWIDPLILCATDRTELHGTQAYHILCFLSTVCSSCCVYLDRGYFFPIAAWGSCWRMARIAVGAVNMEEAPFSDRTRKNAPGSGVPTGLPCKQTQQLVSSRTVTRT